MLQSKMKIASLGIAAALLLGLYSFSNNDRYFAISKNLDLYAHLYRVMHDSYVDEVQSAELMKQGIDGMLKSLDPYTNYITESQIAAARLRQLGSPGDIGITLEKFKDNFVITEVLEGLPADVAGFEPGDVLLEIDGQEVKDRSLEDVQAYLVGEVGSDILLTVEKAISEESFTKNILREKIPPKSVTYKTMLNDEIGYIKLTSFTADCGKFVKEAFKALKDSSDLKGLVFDLRGNGGGLLREAIRIGNIFVDEGELIVSTEGKTEDWNKEYFGQEDPLDLTTPVIVLTNGRSASASEIVSGVIQDHDRGVIMGTNTFGKGLVQNVRELELDFQPKGTNKPRLKLTVAKYLLPSGRCIQSIDYSGRYTDGVSEVPDSLKKEFKTKAGRTVYDGSGVTPDVKFDTEDLPRYTEFLREEKIIFQYANYYKSKNESIAPAEEFEITAGDFADFVSWLDKEEVQFKSETERLLEALEKSAEIEKYAPVIEQDIEEVKSTMKSRNAEFANLQKAEILPLLKEEIVSRYYYQEGKVEATLRDDKLVANAIDLFGKPDEMKAILSVN